MPWFGTVEGFFSYFAPLAKLSHTLSIRCWYVCVCGCVLVVMIIANGIPFRDRRSGRSYAEGVYTYARCLAASCETAKDSTPHVC